MILSKENHAFYILNNKIRCWTQLKQQLYKNVKIFWLRSFIWSCAWLKLLSIFLTKNWQLCETLLKRNAVSGDWLLASFKLLRVFNNNKCFSFYWVLICKVHLTVYSYHVTYAFQSESKLYRPAWLNGGVLVCEQSGCGFESSCSHLNLDFVPVSSKEFLDIIKNI